MRVLAMVRSAPVAARIDDILACGPDGVIVAKGHMPDDLYDAVAEKALNWCREHGAPCFLHVSDRRSDLSHMSVADLVRCGRPGNVAKLLVAVSTLDEAYEASDYGADAVLFGSVYDEGKDEGCDMNDLRMTCVNSDVPVCAWGGIAAPNVQQVHDAGVDAVALTEALAGDPEGEFSAARSVLE